MEKPEEHIPAHEEGTAVDVEDSILLADEEQAKNAYRKVKERLLNINGWHQLAGMLSADFRLTDPSGKEINRVPQKGDYFKINIPAPGIQTGDGYDWVRVEEFLESENEKEEWCSVRVRPASSPVNANKDVAHFYTSEATSNFIVRREGVKVSAGVHGRNEKPNLAAADSLLDKVRNAFVGTGGVTGFAKLQWKSLVDGLLKVD